jgi:hypothetical protein
VEKALSRQVLSFVNFRLLAGIGESMMQSSGDLAVALEVLA